MKLNTEMRVDRISDEVWEIPITEKSGMLVPARIYATPIHSSIDGCRSVRASDERGLSSGDQTLCAVYAGWTLGLRFSHWRRCRL